MKTLFPALIAAARANESVALGIITGVHGSSPQKLGAKALFYSDRKILGTVGGGCLEAEVQRLALQSLHDNKPRTFELVLDHDFGWDDGLICGGKVSGVIIPNAQNLGATFWEDLAQRNEPKTWGIKSDYTIARYDPSGHSFQEPERLLSRPSATLSSIRNGGEGRGEEALGFMERGADRPGEGIFGPLLP
jgi:xanthine/CO dehydrogenase XdhC/CoxF family maturation factor